MMEKSRTTADNLVCWWRRVLAATSSGWQRPPTLETKTPISGQEKAATEAAE